LQSPRGLTAAGALLLVLVVALPGLVSTRSDRAKSEPPRTPAEEAALAAGSESDPLQGREADWLTAEDAPAERPHGNLADAEGPLDCLVQPSRVVEIGSPMTGLIEVVHVDRGDRVEAGQVVVELEASVERAAVDVARMRASLQGELRAREEALVLSTNRSKRGTELFDQRALSVDTREELETQARLAQLELLQAKEARQLASLELRQAEGLLSRRILRSPIAGIVTERLLQPGEIVDEETVLKIAQVDPLRVDVLLPASRYGSVRIGMRATVEPEFPVQASVVATVSIVDPVIDAASGTFSVRLDLPNPDGKIPGGLHCTVKFLDD
jgi:RND family efflux transporter MFP subunit